MIRPTEGDFIEACRGDNSHLMIDEPPLQVARVPIKDNPWTSPDYFNDLSNQCANNKGKYVNAPFLTYRRK